MIIDETTSERKIKVKEIFEVPHFLPSRLTFLLFPLGSTFKVVFTTRGQPCVGDGAERKQVSEEVSAMAMAGKGWYQGLSVLIKCGVIGWLNGKSVIVDMTHSILVFARRVVKMMVAERGVVHLYYRLQFVWC